jgi:hypothetical protein
VIARQSQQCFRRSAPLHGARQGRHVVHERQVEERHSHLERVPHAVGIGVAEERVAHGMRGFEAGHRVERIAVKHRLDAIRGLFEIVGREE